MTRLTLVAWALVALPGGARAERPTTLLQDDLGTNKRTTLDAANDFDDIAGALGGGGFSTKDLSQVEDRLRADLRKERPRATPRLIVFLYPGRMDAEKLRNLREVDVDMELDIDPCDRSVCRDAVAKHIEIVGQAVGKAVYATQAYKVVFKNINIKTATAMHGTDVQAYSIPIAACITAGSRPGGGRAYLDGMEKADVQYEPLMVKAVAQRASAKRVALEGTPQVSRSGGEATVVLKMRADRARVQQQVMDALAATWTALRESPATPAVTHIEVDADTGVRPTGLRKFRSLGAPVGRFLDGQIDSGSLWSSYVEEVKEGKGAGTRMTFSDSDATGGGSGGGAGEANPDEAVATLAQNFAPLGACARAEASKNAHFGGVTVRFNWSPSGHAEGVTTKEPAYRTGPLQKCLAEALSGIRLPRFSGSPTSIDYPIAVKR